MMPPELTTRESMTTGEITTILKFSGGIKEVDAWLDFKCGEAYNRGKQEALATMQKQARQLLKDIFGKEI